MCLGFEFSFFCFSVNPFNQSLSSLFWRLLPLFPQLHLLFHFSSSKIPIIPIFRLLFLLFIFLKFSICYHLLLSGRILQCVIQHNILLFSCYPLIYPIYCGFFFNSFIFNSLYFHFYFILILVSYCEVL